MAAAPRRPLSSFSLSFLDIMFCGFGAVVLLVLIIDTNVVRTRRDRVGDLRAEYLREELEHQLAAEHLERARRAHATLSAEIERLQQQSAALTAAIDSGRADATAAARTETGEAEISSLQDELKSLEREKEQLAAQKAAERQTGRQVRPVAGEGSRQYLTGLQLGGERILILVDSSASMLDTKIVDIIRRKVLDETSRRAAPKWRRAVATVEWLLANLPAQSLVRICHFNTAAIPLAAESEPSWTPVTAAPRLDAMLARLHEVAPLGGTNLDALFQSVRTLAPRPDNIILITDGLPTQGRSGTRSGTITGAGRVKLFDQAIKQLPAGVPVNTILFPIEGDPLAPVLFWKLAVDSGGSFLTPTRDWP